MAGFRLQKRLLQHRKPESPEILVCLDFGTAACKAAATIRTSEQLLLFELGRLSGDQRQKYPISSSLFISAKTRLYFGHEAIFESQKQQEFEIRRMDSIKTWLSTGDLLDPDFIPVDASCNPTSFDFSRGDAITMLLAYVLDFISTQLQTTHGVSYVRRRFTRPIWDQQRASWYDALMVRYIGRAQLVADTLSGTWKDGVPLLVVKEVLDQAKNEEIPGWLVEQKGALEPIAAGVSRLAREHDHRSLAVVVDIGAGTTDMAALTAIQPDGEGEVSKAIPQGTPSSELNAGDVLDRILKDVVLNSLNGQGDLGSLAIQAEQNCRLWKEQLFVQGVVQPTFFGGVIAKEIRRETFLALHAVMEFERKINEQVELILQSISYVAKLYKESSFHSLSHISLIPAGGGARLPVVQNIEGIRDLNGTKLEMKGTGTEPQWFSRAYGRDPNLFPKLAVAIGGASPRLPVFGKDAN